MRIRHLLPAALLLAGTAACNDLLQTEPVVALPQDQMISDAATAQAALNGAYASLQSTASYGRGLLTLGDVAADNAVWTGTFQFVADIANNRIVADNSEITGIWNSAYQQIDRDNVIIQRVAAVPGIPDAVRNDVLGQAHFLRALSYHNLVKYWGAVPMPLEPASSPAVAEGYTRTPVAEVYAQILRDLDRAQSLIQNTANTRQATPTAVRALRARVLLYRASLPNSANAAADLQGALDAAGQVLGASNALTTPYADLFSPAGSNTAEDVFRVIFLANQANSLGFWYLRAGRAELSPSPSLDAAYAPGDLRRAVTIRATGNAGRPLDGAKWGTAAGTEHVHVIRRAELVLIRAEVLARQGNLAGAVEAYNAVRARAGLAPHVLGRDVTTAADVLAAIDRERRLELALEGDRFPDLVRRGVAAQVKGFTDRAYQALMPIPLRELQTTRGLQQNPGY